MITSFRLGSRYLFRYFRRYIFLLAALTFGFAVITAMTSLVEGMAESVYTAGQGHYGGDLFIVGIDRGSSVKFRIAKPQTVLKAVDAAGLKPERIAERTQFGLTGEVYFNGASVRHKYVFGVDWQKEKSYFETVRFSEGGFDRLTGKNDIFLSKPVAKELNTRVGDKVVLEVKTRTGQRNTGSFIVRGIINDSSIFGYYKCYINRKVLNSLLRYNKGDASIIGLYFKNRKNLFAKADALHRALEGKLQLAPVARSRNDLEAQQREKWTGIRYFIFPLPVYITEVTDLLTALKLISYFLYIMMVLIIMVSIFVTYKLILHERAGEISIMRAIGFSAGSIDVMLLTEAVLLSLISICLGWVFGRLIVWMLSLFSYSWIPGFEIFLRNGRLTAVYSIKTTVINAGIVLFTVFLSVFVPAAKAVRRKLTESLSGGAFN